MELVPGTVIAGRYRLERLLASGGMGAVWVARHQTQGIDVAIKFMHGDPTELTVARGRFEREARTASLIRHPNVVTVIDYGIEGQTPYMTMELLHGENLDDYLVRKTRLPLGELEPIISQVSRGLRKAHETGIVHRDLKPSNIFISREGDGREVVKILDFGIAKEIDTTLGQHTKTTELMGSPHYMSPEQLRSTKKSDFRSDLWSLGVIIYKALTGVTPFPGDTLAEVMVQVFSGKWTPPSTVVPGLSPTVDAFFQRVFARKPDDRFQSIHDMHNAFVAVVAGKPLPAPTTAVPAANPSATPVPFATSSSPAWPGVAIPPPRASAPSAIPVASLPTPEAEVQQAPPPPVFSAFSAPETTQVTSPFAAASPPTPPSNPGLSAPQNPAASAPPVAGFGIPNQTPPVVANWQESPAPVAVAPENPAPEVRGGLPSIPATNLEQFEPTVYKRPIPVVNPERPGKRVVPIVGGIAVVLIGIVVLVSALGDSSDKPGPTSENSGANRVKTPGSADVPATPVSSGSALTPEEIASAVPDETPVEDVSNEPAQPTPSATQAPKFKTIAKGQGRLLIKATGGVCKVTINSTYYGQTPLDVTVDAGKARIFCRTSTGSTRSKEVRVPEGRATKIEFDVKQ